MFKFFVACCVLSSSLFGLDLTLEEKVGQLLMVSFQGSEANDDSRMLIQEMHIGGVIYYNWANELSSPDQVQNLSATLQAQALQKRTPIPLLIAADQEGGRVARLKSGFPLFPSNEVVGQTENPLNAQKVAFEIGALLRQVGINMNLAPVVDINSNPLNPVIGNRSFGNSADIVIPFAMSALEGYNQSQVVTCLKHFPGHGDTNTDSHTSLPIVHKTYQELRSSELRPFYELAPVADTIMTAHILLPAIDPDNCATLSPKIIDLLRHEAGFNGVIITDSLVMDGLLQNCPSLEEASIRALEAGCDMVLLGGKRLVGSERLALTVEDIQIIHDAIVEAVVSGRITENRIDESVERILALKMRYDLYCD